MQTISELTVLNFRSCKNLKKLAIDNFTPLIGYNNAGKSNVLSAVHWLIKKSSLDAAGFFNPTEEVSVSARIGGIDDKVLSALGPEHKRRIEPYISEHTLAIRRTQASPGVPIGQVRLLIQQPDHIGVDDNGWDVNPTGIDGAIAALFPDVIPIGAMEDATKDISKSESGSTIGKLITQLMRQLEADQDNQIAERIKELDKLLSAEGTDCAKELDQFDETANDIVKEFFPGVRVKAHIPAPTLTTVFKAGTLRIYEDGIQGQQNSEGRDVGALGHGAQRAIQMALVRMLAEKTAAPQAGRTLLLIDEPELYLHPQAASKVRSALVKLSKGSYQVVFTTHSPVMLGRDSVGSAHVLRKAEDGATVTRKRLGDAARALQEGAPHQWDMLFSFHGATEILFSDRVMLLEGKTEKELIPDIFEFILGVTPADLRIGMVSLGGSGDAEKCMRILEAMEIPHRALVDLDYAFRGAIGCKLLEADDPDVNACRTLCGDVAQELGGEVESDGFFCGPKRIECLERLAQVDKAIGPIESLHQKLRDKGLWLWKRGTIETHLGLGGKTATIWSRFRGDLKSNGLSDAPDQSGVRECIRWLSGTRE